MPKGKDRMDKQAMYGLVDLSPILASLVQKLEQRNGNNPALFNFKSFSEHFSECANTMHRHCFDSASDQVTLILSKTDGQDSLYESATVIVLDALEALKNAYNSDSQAASESIHSAMLHFSALN